MPSFPKDNAFRSKAWLRAVASLPCVDCGVEGQTQAAHINMGKGMGIKTHDCWTAALCLHHHHQADQGTIMSKDEKRRYLDTAVLLTLAELAKRGMVKP